MIAVIVIQLCLLAAAMCCDVGYVRGSLLGSTVGMGLAALIIGG